MEYAKRVKKFYDQNCALHENNSLKIFTNDFRQHLQNLSKYMQEFAEKVKKNCIKPIENMLANQVEEGYTISKEYKRIDKEYKDASSNLEKTRVKFLAQYQSAEYIIKDYETAKACNSHQGIEKFQGKTSNSLKEAKEAEKNYLIQLTKTNGMRGLYIDDARRLLTEIESLEIEYGIITKQGMENYLSSYSEVLSNQNFDVEKMEFTLSRVNIEEDLMVFIAENKKNYCHPPKYDYTPYKVELRSVPICNQTISPEIILNTIQTIQDNLEIKYDDWDLNDELSKLKIIESTNKVIKGEDISDEDIALLTSLLDEKKYRLLFLTTLNTYRIRGQFMLSDYTFEIIGKLMKRIMSLISVNNDYESAKFVIILSQTFKSQQNSLQFAIQNVDILKSREFWESMIKHLIDEETTNHLTFNNCNESKEDKDIRLQNLVFGQLITASYNMKEFKIDAPVVNEVVMQFADLYCLNESLTELLSKHQE